MSPVLVDSNVIIDVASANPRWFAWSASALAEYAERDVLVINPIVFAEISAGYDSIEETERAVPLGSVRRDALPYEAAFLAAQAFRRYRQAGGVRRSPLPDFYIGAHAAVAGYSLLTRDATRYRTFFPRLTLIAPDA